MEGTGRVGQSGVGISPHPGSRELGTAPGSACGRGREQGCPGVTSWGGGSREPGRGGRTDVPGEDGQGGLMAGRVVVPWVTAEKGHRGTCQTTLWRLASETVL